MTSVLSSESAADVVASSSRHDVRDYTLAHLGKSVFWVAGDALTMCILIRYSGYQPAAAGWLFLAALFWNAICDVAVGYWADRRAATGRSLAPILCVTAPMLGIAFVVSLFLRPQEWPWTLLAALVFRTSFALFDVPHNTMMARMSTTPAIGLRIANLRTIAAGTAALAVGFVALPLLDSGGEVYALPLVLGLSSVSIVLMLPFLGVLPRLERLPYQPTAIVCSPAAAPTLGFTRLCAISACGTVVLAALSKAIFHLDLVHNRWAKAALLAMMLGRIAAIVTAGGLIARFGKARTLCIAYTAATLLIMGLPVALAAGEWMPLVFFLLLGLALGTEIIVSWLILAALVRASTASMRYGASRFGIFTMITKVTTGIGGLILGLLLSSPDTTATPLPVMQGATLWSLCALAAVGTTVAAWLTRTKHAMKSSQ
jgi:GPH family glycoside/pentoside/hexuronide:cation symporter